MAYTVKAGDSLWAIAQATLGDGSRWPEIQAANGIAGTTIQPGQVFNIPGQDSTAPTDRNVAVTPGETVFSPGKPPPPPAVNPDTELYQDPAYYAYMAGLGTQKSEIAGRLLMKKDNYDQQLGEALPGYADARKDNARVIDNNSENRGMFQSGQRLRDRSESDETIDAQLAGTRGLWSRNQAEAQRTATEQETALDRQTALESINARERLSARDLNAIGAPL